MTEDIRSALKARPGMAAVFAMAGGICLGRAGQMDIIPALLLAAAISLSILLAGRALGAFLALSALAGAAIILRLDMADPEAGLNLAGVRGRPVTAEAEVVTADSERIRNVRMTLRLLRINGATSPAAVIAYLDYSHPLARALPGDVFRLDPVKLYPITGFHNAGGWDYERYIKDQGIGARMTVSKKTQARLIGRSWSMARVMEEARRESTSRLAGMIRDKDALAVSKAMLTGDQGFVGPELRDIYSRAGTAHLLSVSGLHVGFITAAAFYFFKAALFLIIYPINKSAASSGIWVRIAAVLTLPAIWLFLLFTGPQLPAFRAGVMIGTYMIAVAMGRPREFYGAFALSMGLILAAQPWALFTASFQLSFASVFFITVLLEKYYGTQDPGQVYSKMERLAPSWPMRAMERFPILTSAFVTSIFAGVGSGPLAAHHFHVASLVSPLANIPAVLLGSLATPVGIVGLMLDSARLTSIAVWLIHPITAISYISAKAPLAFVHTAGFSQTACAIFYASAGMAILSNNGGWRKAALAAAVMALAFGFAAGRVKGGIERGMTMRFLDMGQGDCTLISWPGGAMAVDAGPASPSFDAGRMVVAPALWGMNKHRLDAFFATHGDYDHVGGAAGLMERMETKMVYGPATAKTKPALAMLRGLAAADGIYRSLKAGDRLEYPGGPAVLVLNPPGWKTPYKTAGNNASLVLKIVFGQVSVLLPSDISKDVEKWLVSSGADLKARVLKIPHHGSSSSSSRGFLQAVNPEYAVISVGRDNPHGHPSREVLRRLLDRGLKLYRTDRNGEVTLWTDGAELKLDALKRYLPQDE